MPGTRQFRDPDETTVKLTLAVPKDLDRQLRALAARQGIGVGPLVRGWIEKELMTENKWLRRLAEIDNAAN